MTFDRCVDYRRLGGWLAIGLGLAVAPAAAIGAPLGGDPWADEVVDVDFGSGGSPGYDFAPAILGEPERFTGEGLFPSVVSPFSGPFMPDEILSIGAGGFIVVRFDEPVADDPRNPYGVDLLVFANTGFIDGDYPAGMAAGVFSDDGGQVDVSQDGESWVVLPGSADGLFPTLGYLDSGPYDAIPGSQPSDFTRPVNPGLTLPDFLGADLATIASLYEGSGGGAGFDLASTGLTAISYVRISVSRSSIGDVELDAMADVTPAGVLGDLDGNEIVDGADLGVLLGGWGGPGPGDLDGSGTIDGADLGILLAEFEGV